MAKVLCIHDNPLQAAMFADMLKRRDRVEVVTMTSPLDLEAVAIFAPDLVVVGLVRKVGSLRSRLANFYAEVEGAHVLKTLIDGLGTGGPRIVVAAIAVEAGDLPDELGHPLLLALPFGLGQLLCMIDRLTEAPSTLEPTS